MAVPESEEVGFKRIGLSTNDYDASLPIKKRRFPVVQSPPSPPKDISSCHPDGNLMKPEQPSPPKDFALSHADENLIKSELPSQSVASSYSAVPSSGLSNTNQNSVLDENKGKSDTDSCYVDMVQSDIGIQGVKFQEPRLGGRVCFHGFVEREGKSLVTEIHTVQASPEISEGLELSSTSLNSDPLAGNKDEKIDVKVGGAEVSVGLKEPINLKLAPEKSDLNFLKQNSSEPVALDLSLNKQGSSTNCVECNVGSDYDGSLQQSNRENWDLNTSMEFWEGYASDDTPLQFPVVQTNTIVTTHRCSTEMVKTDILSEKLTPSHHGDQLHLSLSSADLREVRSREQSTFAKLDFRKINPFLSLPNRGMRLDGLNGTLKVVKPEPFAEGSKLEFESDEVNGLGLSDGAAVKRELNDQCSLEIPNGLDICSPMNIVKAKSESVYESKQKALKTLGGRLDLVAMEDFPEVDNSCPIAMPSVAEMSEAPGNPSSSSTDLISDVDMSNHSELPSPAKGLGLSDGAVVKRELDDQRSLEIPNTLDICSPTNIVKAKSESVYESKQKALKTLGGRLDLVAKEDFPQVDNSCHIAMPFVAKMSEAAGNPSYSCSTDLIADVDMSKHSELQTPTKEHLNMKIHEGGYDCGGEFDHSEITDIRENPGSKDSNGHVIKPIVLPVATEMLEEARNPSSSTDLIIDGDMSNHSELPTPTEGPLSRKEHQGGYVCGGRIVNSEMTDVCKDPGSKDSSSSIKSSIVEDENQNNTQGRPLKLTSEQCSSLQGDEESYVNDEEKISLSADLLEEDPYSSEYESDCNQDVNETMDAVDNDIEEDYEDGEVREPILKTPVESSVCEKREVKIFNQGDCSDELPSIDCTSLVSVKQEHKLEIHDIKRDDNLHSLTSNQSSEEEKLKALVVEENTTSACLNNANKAIKPIGKRQFFECDNIDALKDQQISSEVASDGIEEPIVKVPQCDAENVKTVDFVQDDDLALPNVKEPLNNDVTDDFSHGSRHSQIVNPCQASTSSPGKTRSNLMRSVLTQTDREQVPDIAQEGGKLQSQGRDDPYSDVSQKFYLNRHPNLSPPQTNFTRRRGRFTIRINSVQGEWDFNPTISPGIYNDQIPPYDSRRRKYMPAVSDDDIDQNHYKIKPDGPFHSAGHRGRHILDDEGPLFCHMPSRRRSPGRRDGPPVRGVKMVHRMPRNISPSRCIREPGSELVGLRHGEKFMRTLEDETMDPMYPHPQPPFEVDRPPFIRDRRNFPIQRKSFPRVDSRSPGRSRGRSPGQWFPSKRKSDRFFGHSEMARRSPPGYRIRSPDQPPPIDGDMPIRRHGFPFSPLPSNDMRDQGHMRSAGIRGRNRTDRISFRNRRFEDMDPRDRIEGGEYFDGPVHPGQLNEMMGDGNDDDRRRFPERHEHLHPFQPQCNNSDGENYHNDVDERGRPFRFCPGDEPEFHERGKLREREFDRRVKNQPGNLPRRTGVMEEHEVEDYRHGRQLWNEHHAFEDISRMKRKRF